MVRYLLRVCEYCTFNQSLVKLGCNARPTLLIASLVGADGNQGRKPNSPKATSVMGLGWWMAKGYLSKSLWGVRTGQVT
jgi:hypothetical protein